MLLLEKFLQSVDLFGLYNFTKFFEILMQLQFHYLDHDQPNVAADYEVCEKSLHENWILEKHVKMIHEKQEGFECKVLWQKLW